MNGLDMGKLLGETRPEFLDEAERDAELRRRSAALRKRRRTVYFSVAAAAVVLLGTGSVYFATVGRGANNSMSYSLKGGSAQDIKAAGSYDEEAAEIAAEAADGAGEDLFSYRASVTEGEYDVQDNVLPEDGTMAATEAGETRTPTEAPDVNDTDVLGLPCVYIRGITYYPDDSLTPDPSLAAELLSVVDAETDLSGLSYGLPRGAEIYSMTGSDNLLVKSIASDGSIIWQEFVATPE